MVADGDFLVGLHAAALDPADADPAHIVVIVDGRNEQLQRRRLVRVHGRDMVEDGIEQGREVLPLVVGIARGGARPARTEDDGAFQLVVGGVQVDEKFQDLVLHLGDARVGAVDLVDDDDQFMLKFQRLLHDEARLRHGAFRRVYEQQYAVDHLQNALHLAAEIGVAGGVDDVDLDAVVMHGRVLGQDGDAALALDGVGVHHPLLYDLVLSECAALPEHLVHQRCLAVVYVCDDRYISQIVAYQKSLLPITKNIVSILILFRRMRKYFYPKKSRYRQFGCRYPPCFLIFKLTTAMPRAWCGFAGTIPYP